MSVEDKYLQAFEWCFRNSKIAETKKKESLMHVASELGLYKLVEKLIQKGVGVNCQDSEKVTPLHIAAEKDNVCLAKLLLQNNADVNCLDEDGKNPLTNALISNHLEMINLLIQHGAEIQNIEHQGFTPLSMTSRNGNVDVAKLLLQKVAEVNFGQSSHTTYSLLQAVLGNHTEMVKLLIDNGANVNANTRYERWIVPRTYTKKQPAPFHTR